ncbi:MAG: hypothetical protein EZS28_019738 [Streblomastix strix]|uniref:Uncharacterized protein n=1 Tax=Streblomastix strix TaxID=222440 RepID=A0A5J4VQH4_9EUKA|nr:MAG: hypothetical protein EZS28_019738 [Streblomastix strix]
MWGYENIILWHLRSGNELDRIKVPNVTCLCVCFNLSRTEMISGWSDGKIRSFGPESGRIQHVIGRDSQQLLAIMKEHNMLVTTEYAIHDDLECVSSGSDGQKITWSLIRRIHLQQMIKTANFHGCRLLSSQLTIHYMQLRSICQIF